MYGEVHVNSSYCLLLTVHEVGSLFVVHTFCGIKPVSVSINRHLIVS
jgi:hypothetical protein